MCARCIETCAGRLYICAVLGFNLHLIENVLSKCTHGNKDENLMFSYYCRIYV